MGPFMRRNLTSSLSSITTLLSLSFYSCGKPTYYQSLRTAALNLNESETTSILDYQIGPTWDKSEVTKDLLTTSNSTLVRTAQATARLTVMFSTSTGFVVGHKDDQVMLATNHHVIQSQKFCDETKVAFEILNIKRLHCDKVILTDTELDLTLFTIKGLTEKDREKLLAVALPLSKHDPRKGQNLITIGYGFAENKNRRLMVDQGPDCKTYSADNDIRFMADPDILNPGPYKTWVFAVGCDVSHGDSGSAVVERSTGEVVGILSTGKIPKIARVRSSDFLKKIHEGSTEEVWTELTYVVPFSKILDSYGNLISL